MRTERQRKSANHERWTSLAASIFLAALVSIGAAHTEQLKVKGDKRVFYFYIQVYDPLEVPIEASGLKPGTIVGLVMVPEDDRGEYKQFLCAERSDCPQTYQHSTFAAILKADELDNSSAIKIHGEDLLRIIRGKTMCHVALASIGPPSADNKQVITPVKPFLVIKCDGCTTKDIARAMNRDASAASLDSARSGSTNRAGAQPKKKPGANHNGL